ncbi:DUF2768 family protein [Paenibacillus contaminans]|jgi:amino acid permease|uniref:DUF2768 domain-containing protein n=1 Tax=Paenibacillus contaminans TaxID=450362 RepID=A0A329MKZ3_9BACL|nr:DUF2768 family protein [Paenibacillus contaminans]RAV18537.1 DUF2768 domain-containing protein [Paenibacillus contaminans]
MSSMDKMWATMYAIGFMVVASLLVMYARYKIKYAWLRVLIIIIAFILLIYGVLLALAGLL